MRTYLNEIAYIQIENNPGRNPNLTTAEINYRNVLNWIHEKRFRWAVLKEHW